MNPVPRKNRGIQAEKVRVVGDRMEQVGILSLTEALALAEKLGCDVIEIAPSAVPPVCRLVQRKRPGSATDEIGMSE
jgi:translation initiation factor IF-3